MLSGLSSLVERWLRAESLGILAYFGSINRQNGSAIAYREFVQALCRQLGNTSEQISESLCRIRPSIWAIKMLGELAGDEKFPSSLEPEIVELTYAVTDAAHELCKPRSNYISHALLAKQIGYAIFYGSMPAAGIFRLLESAFAKEKRYQPRIEPINSFLIEFQKAVNELRPPSGRMTLYSDEISSKSLLTFRTTEQQTQAVDRLRSLICQHFSSDAASEGAFHWNDLENALLRLVYHWPLMVPEKRNITSMLAGLAMPVGIDVNFNANGHGATASTILPQQGLIDITEWERPLECLDKQRQYWIGKRIGRRGKYMHLNSLEYCVYAAKLHWKQLRPSKNQLYRSVERAGIQFDFSMANELLRTASSVLPEDMVVPVRAIGRSMEVYFCGSVLNRLLGNHSVSSTIATGVLGLQPEIEFQENKTAILPGVTEESDRRGYGVYFPIEKVNGLGLKATNVAVMTIFDKFIMPDRRAIGSEELEALDNFYSIFRMHVPTAYCNNLRPALSAMIPQMNSRRFVRCPDFARLQFRSYAKLSSVRQAKTEIFREAHDVPVLTLDRSVRGIDVVKTLVTQQVERQKEYHHQYKAGRLDYWTKFTWSAIRCVPYERDEKFWRTLWHVLGAPASELEKLVASDDPRVAAGIIAEALCHEEVTSDNPAFCPPNLIVLVGPSKLGNGNVQSGMSGPSQQVNCQREVPRSNPMITSAADRNRDIFHPLSFTAVLPHLINALQDKERANPSLRELLGKKRIILVHEDKIPGLDHCKAKRQLSEIERIVFESVGAVLFSASYSAIASIAVTRLMMEVGGKRDPNTDRVKKFASAVRETLESLVRDGFIRKLSGQYFDPQSLGQSRRSTDTDKALQISEAAGLALAPYLQTGNTRAVELSAGFSPVVIHESEFHLAESNRWLYRPKYLKTHMACLEFDGYGNPSKYNPYIARSLAPFYRRRRFRETQLAVVDFPSWNNILAAQIFKGIGRSRLLLDTALRLARIRGDQIDPQRLALVATAAEHRHRRSAGVEEDPGLQVEIKAALDLVSAGRKRLNCLRSGDWYLSLWCHEVEINRLLGNPTDRTEFQRAFKQEWESREVNLAFMPPVPLMQIADCDDDDRFAANLYLAVLKRTRWLTALPACLGSAKFAGLPIERFVGMFQTDEFKNIAIQQFDPGQWTDRFDSRSGEPRDSYLRSCFGSAASPAALARLVKRVTLGIDVGQKVFRDDEFWSIFFDAVTVGFRQYTQPETYPRRLK